MKQSGLWQRARRLLSVERDNPELLKAQYREFSKKLPLMYFVLLVNSWGLATTYFGHAPAWLAVYVPIGLTVICALRFAAWFRTRNDNPTPEVAWHALTRSNRIAAPVAATFTAWAILLFPYGDAYAKAHVAFYMGITVISCIFSLMHLRSAALIVAAIVNVTFVVFFALTGTPTFVATSINVALVSSAMLFIVVGNYRDFTRLIAAQVRTAALSDENLRIANLDSLTGLPNRRKFFAELDALCVQARRRSQRLAVGILDLDGFKAVNDLYGHALGDRLLADVGRRLLELHDEHLHLARLGGDEFAMIVTGNPDDAQLEALGDRVCAALRGTFAFTHTVVQIAGSIGLATYPDMAGNATDLYEYADYALYHGKRDNRGAITLFTVSHQNRIHLDARIEQELRKADFQRELSVEFQPIVDAASRRTIAFEALARWNNPALGQVPPEHFIPVAERTGIINQQTRILLRKALAAAARWPGHVRLSFNLSAYDLSAPESVRHLIRLIEESGFDPRRVDLEITETAMMHDIDQTRWAANLLRKLGCGITLDDFGTGYSSLNQLHTLPLTQIKIDRSFVAGIRDNPASYKIVKSLLALSRDMELGCVVEGVETQDEMDVVRELGGTTVQGFLFSVPIPESGIHDWLAGDAPDTPDAASLS